MRWSRHCVSTWIVTSSGMWPPSMSSRQKSKSVWLARREADLDLLVAHLDEQLEHAQLALGVHRVDEGLVAVAQVDGAPARGAGRCASSATCGPGARRGSARGTGRTSGTAFPTSAGGGSSLHSLRLRFARCPAGHGKLRDEEGRGQASSRQRRRRLTARTHFTVCRSLGCRPPLGTAARIVRPASQATVRRDALSGRRSGPGGRPRGGVTSSRASAICSSGRGGHRLVVLEDLELVVVRRRLRHVRLLARSLGRWGPRSAGQTITALLSGVGKWTLDARSVSSSLRSSAQFPSSGSGHSTRLGSSLGRVHGSRRSETWALDVALGRQPRLECAASVLGKWALTRVRAP